MCKASQEKIKGSIIYMYNICQWFMYYLCFVYMHAEINYHFQFYMTVMDAGSELRESVHLFNILAKVVLIEECMQRCFMLTAHNVYWFVLCITNICDLDIRASHRYYIIWQSWMLVSKGLWSICSKVCLDRGRDE